MKTVKQKIIKKLSTKRWFFDFALNIIANRIVHCNNRLTPEYLIERGYFLDQNGFYSDPNIKDRDKIWIQFDHHYFRLFHGPQMTFIALESKVEWYETYFLMVHPDNGRYNLASVF